MNKYADAFKKYEFNLKDDLVTEIVDDLIDRKFKENYNKDTLKFLYACIDLTSLNSDDSQENIWKFVQKVNDFDGSRPDMNSVAGICVYPNLVKMVKQSLTVDDVRIVSVSGGFPSSQTFQEVKIAETALALKEGADEIDIVMNIGQLMDEDYEELCSEIEEIKDVCKDRILKVIIESGLLKTAVNIKKASILSMYSGADFIKTSTGKVYMGATVEAAYTISKTIKEYYALHHRKVGIKISGGVRSAEDAVKYYTIVKEVLGEEWLNSDLFRIGASGLADNLLDRIG